MSTILFNLHLPIVLPWDTKSTKWVESIFRRTYLYISGMDLPFYNELISIRHFHWATIFRAYNKAKYFQRQITKYLSGCHDIANRVFFSSYLHDWILSGGGIGKLPIKIQLNINGSTEKPDYGFLRSNLL